MSTFNQRITTRYAWRIGVDNVPVLKVIRKVGSYIQDDIKNNKRYNIYKKYNLQDNNQG